MGSVAMDSEHDEFMDVKDLIIYKQAFSYKEDGHLRTGRN
jgi:hypothetical protein